VGWSGCSTSTHPLFHCHFTPLARYFLPSPFLLRRYRLAFGTSDKLQAAALVAAFEKARAIMTAIRSGAAAAAAAV
jgi:hypothetical protein